MGDPNAAISSVPLSTLNYKNFTKEEMKIDAPYDLTIKTGIDEEEESTPDMRMLYQRFNDKIANDLILPNKIAGNKKE